MTIHGGNIYELASRAGCSPDEILDFSASINPLGPPPGLWEYLSRYRKRLEHYPDIHNRLIFDSLSDYFGIGSDCMAVGNGSTELIYWLPRALGVDRVLAAAPTFGEYVKAFELHGAKVRQVQCAPEDNFQPRVGLLEKEIARSAPEAVLLTHPGTPAGALLSAELVEWVVKRSQRGRRIFIIDEVFVDFCEDSSFMPHLWKSPNLVIIRSLTKFYALPGLRIGYLFSSGGIAEKIRYFVPPWSVNSMAQLACAYCLGNEDYRQHTLKVVAEERQKMTKSLAAIDGLRVFPGVANYILVQMDRQLPSAVRMREDLFDSERLLIRDCGSFEGLDDWYFRIAVRLPDQNEKLIRAIRGWVKAAARFPLREDAAVRP